MSDRIPIVDMRGNPIGWLLVGGWGLLPILGGCLLMALVQPQGCIFALLPFYVLGLLVALIWGLTRPAGDTRKRPVTVVSAVLLLATVLLPLCGVGLVLILSALQQNFQ